MFFYFFKALLHKGSAEYVEVQRLVKMQDEVSRSYQADLYAMDSVRDYNSVYLYPNDHEYGALPDSYKKKGIQSDPDYIAKLKADNSRGANAVIAAGTTVTGAIGSSTRLFGVDDKTADNLAIGGGILGTVVGSGIGTAFGTGGALKGSGIGKNEVLPTPKTVMTNSNTNNGLNSGKNVYVILNLNGKLFFDTNQSLRSADKRDPNTPTLIADRVNEKLEKNPNRRLPNANMSSAHGEIGAIQQLANAGMAKNANIILEVKGKDVCGYCKGDIVILALN